MMTANNVALDHPRRVTILSSVHLALDNRVFYREARSLAKAGYDVTLIAVHDRDEVRDGVKILALPTVPRWQRPYLWQRLMAMAVSSKAEVYHFHDPELLLLSPFLRLRTGRPTIYDVHEVYPEFVEVKEYLPGWLRRPLAHLVGIIEPALANHESGLIFADDEIAAAFAAIHKPKATLFNYPDISHFVEREPATRSSDSAPTILYLGGMERNRGALLMLEAFCLVVKAVPQAQLSLVGHFAPPDLETEMRQLIQDLQLESSVQVTGRVPFADVQHYLNAAAVGWVPWQAYRKNELNIPTKLFEYMIAGLPVVASDLSSVRPYVGHGVNGLLVRADDVQAHADAIVYLLQHRDLAVELGANGRERVIAEFNWSAIEPRLLALYDQLLSPTTSTLPNS